MRLLSLIVIGGIGYYLYTTVGKTSLRSEDRQITIDQNDLPKIQNIAHDKTYNPLYDQQSNSNIQIVHHFSSQVMPHAYNFAIM